MKKSTIIISALACVICAASCSAFDDFTGTGKASRKNAGTRSDEQSVVVELSDVKDFIYLRSLHAVSHSVFVKDSNYFYSEAVLLKKYYEANDVSITAYPDEELPRIFIANYADHWEAISSNKRTPAVVARGWGNLDMSTADSETVNALQALADDIKALDEIVDAIPDEDQYRSEWSSVSIMKKDISNSLDGLDIDEMVGPDANASPLTVQYYIVLDIPEDSIPAPIADTLWVNDETGDVTSSIGMKVVPRDTTDHPVPGHYKSQKGNGVAVWHAPLENHTRLCGVSYSLIYRYVPVYYSDWLEMANSGCCPYAALMTSRYDAIFKEAGDDVWVIDSSQWFK